MADEEKFPAAYVAEKTAVAREFARLKRLAFPASAKAREIVRENVRLWRLAFPDINNATRRNYTRTEAGKIAIRNGNRRYESSAHGKIMCNLKCARRRSRQRITQGCENKIKKIYTRAQELRQWFDVVVDHIIPLSKGGPHSPENLQIIYRKENNRKSDKLGYTPQVIFS